MLADLKNTIKQSAIYGLSRVASKLVSFILIPLYTAKFTSDAVANINLLESFWQYLFTICMFAFETAIINFCAVESNDSKRKNILFNFFLLLLFNSIIILSAGFLYSSQISEFILNQPGLENVVLYCFLISVFESLLILPLTIARLNEKPFLYAFISIASLLINLILQLYFILNLQLGFDYIFVAKFIAPAFLFVLFVPYVIKNLIAKIDFTEIKNILRFSFPLMAAMLFSILLNTVDRFVLTDYVSLQDVAIYTTGYSIGSVTNAFILTPFIMAINFIYLKKISDDNFGRFMTKTSTYLFSGMIFISLILSLIVPHAVKLFVRNPELLPSIKIIPFILFANCFVALFTFPQLDFYHKRKTNVILYIILICLIFKLVTNIIFISSFGIYASAVITIITYVLMFALGYFFTKNYSFTKFEFGKIVLLSILFILIAGTSYLINPGGLFASAVIKLLLIFLFVFILIILKFFEPIEIERIKGFFNKYIIKKFR